VRYPVMDRCDVRYQAAAWLYEGMAAAYESGAARLAITSVESSLLWKEDPEKVRPGRIRSSVEGHTGRRWN